MSSSGCIKNRNGHRLQPCSIHFSKRRLGSFARAGLQHRSGRWQPLRMEVCRGRIFERRCVIQREAAFAGREEYVLVPYVWYELRSTRKFVRSFQCALQAGNREIESSHAKTERQLRSGRRGTRCVVQQDWIACRRCDRTVTDRVECECKEQHYIGFLVHVLRRAGCRRRLGVTGKDDHENRWMKRQDQRSTGTIS